jgi:hypothetical protein
LPFTGSFGSIGGGGIELDALVIYFTGIIVVIHVHSLQTKRSTSLVAATSAAAAAASIIHGVQ